MWEIGDLQINLMWFRQGSALSQGLALKLPSFIHESPLVSTTPWRRVFHCVPRRALYYTCSSVAGLAHLPLRIRGRPEHHFIRVKYVARGGRIDEKPLVPFR